MPDIFNDLGDSNVSSDPYASMNATAAIEGQHPTSPHQQDAFIPFQDSASARYIGSFLAEVFACFFDKPIEQMPAAPEEGSNLYPEKSDGESQWIINQFLLRKFS